MAMIVLSSPATLTGLDKKKTGPSRFIADFLTGLSELSKFRIYQHADSQFTRIIHLVYSRFTVSLHGVYTWNTSGVKFESPKASAIISKPLRATCPRPNR